MSYAANGPLEPRGINHEDSDLCMCFDCREAAIAGHDWDVNDDR